MPERVSLDYAVIRLRRPRPEQLRRWRGRYGLNQTNAASLAGISVKQWQNYEKATQSMHPRIWHSLTIQFPLPEPGEHRTIPGVPESLIVARGTY